VLLVDDRPSRAGFSQKTPGLFTIDSVGAMGQFPRAIDRPSWQYHYGQLLQLQPRTNMQLRFSVNQAEAFRHTFFSK
jgi:hypothetical protein